MEFIDRCLRKYYAVKHDFCKLEAKENKILVKELKNEIKLINKENQLGTSTWEKYRKKLRSYILNKDLTDFLNWDVIQSTMFHDAKRIEYKLVKSKKELSMAVQESSVGNPRPYFLNKKTSGNLVHHAFSLAQIIDKMKIQDLDNVVEFGGGYGSMCRLIRNLGYKKQYTIFDLPEFSSLQKYFLKSVNEEYMINTNLTGDPEDLKQCQSKNLFIATWSFSEMPIELREKLLQTLKFDFCVIAFQDNFDGIDNIEYFGKFKQMFNEMNFEVYPINHLPRHYYLIGIKA